MLLQSVKVIRVNKVDNSARMYDNKIVFRRKYLPIEEDVLIMKSAANLKFA